MVSHTAPRLNTIITVSWLCTDDKVLSGEVTAYYPVLRTKHADVCVSRLYAFRSPEVGFEVETAVGHRIFGVRRVSLCDLLRASAFYPQIFLRVLAPMALLRPLTFNLWESLRGFEL